MTHISDEAVTLPALPKPAGWGYEHGADMGTPHYSAEQMEAYARAALAAAPHMGVKVKGLEWSANGCVAAAPVVGLYVMNETSPGRFALHTPFHSDEEAQQEVQAAAQADYEARILSALVASPHMAGDPVCFISELGMQLLKDGYTCTVFPQSAADDVFDRPLYLHPAPPSSGLMEEVKALRQIISECAEACGAGIAPTASIEFMAKLPDEIRLSANLKDATP